MKDKSKAGLLTAGFLAGMLVGTPTTQAVSDYIKAVPSKQAIYVDGQRVSLNAFTIGGTNYVTLRDAGRVVSCRSQGHKLTPQIFCEGEWRKPLRPHAALIKTLPCRT